MKVKWLERNMIPGPYLVLCTKKKQYKKVVKKLKITDPDHWLKGEKSLACVHQFEKSPIDGGGLVCVVCINPNQDLTDETVIEILVHESVHIWQYYERHIGEINTSFEFEAYSIHGIFISLWEEFKRQKEKNNANTNTNTNT